MADEHSSTQVLAPHIAMRKLIPLQDALNDGGLDLNNYKKNGSKSDQLAEGLEADQNTGLDADENDQFKADQTEDSEADKNGDEDSNQHEDADSEKHEDSDLSRTIYVHSLRKHMTQEKFTFTLRGQKTEVNYADEEVFDCSRALVTADGWELESGLFKAIKMAYSGHYRLHLRPDDIWLAIAQGVSAHLTYQNNAEKYRKVFVDHEGKEEILIFADSCKTGDSTLLDWPRCVQMIVSELESRVKGDTCQLLVNDFSTTDLVSKTASQIVLMDTMKHFFEYRMTFECGIPSVTLHGTLRDWERLVEKARALRALRIGLDWWLDDLDPVLEKLVETYRGHVDEDWWSRVIRSEQSYGSGYTPEYITGWVCTLFPYERRGDRVSPRWNSISGDNLPKGLVECPFTLDGYGQCLLVAGSCAVSVRDDGGVVPCIGWLVKRAPAKKE